MTTLSSICYHYIARDDEFKKIWGHTFELFKKHITFLQGEYEIINPKDILVNKFEDDKNYMLLTFDDGLKEHVRIADYLDTLGVKGVFAIPACVLREEPSNPQIIHFSAAYYGNKKFYDFVTEEIENNFPKYLKILPEDSHKVDEKKLLKILKNIFKRGIQHIEGRKILLNVYENHLKKDFPNFMEMVHLSKEDIIDLVNCGHTIAVHTDTHPSIKEVENDKELLGQEVLQAKKDFEDLLGKEVATFAYPFGEASDILESTDYFKDNNYKLVLTTFSADEDFNAYNLGRYCTQSSDSTDVLTEKLWKYKVK